MPPQWAYVIGAVAKNDESRSKEAPPRRQRLPVPRHRLVDGMQANARDRRGGSAGVAGDRDPEVRDPGAGPADAAPGPGTLAQDRPRRLPGAADGPQEGTGPTPGIAIQRPAVGDPLDPERGQVEGTPQLEAVGLLVHGAE